MILNRIAGRMSSTTTCYFVLNHNKHNKVKRIIHLFVSLHIVDKTFHRWDNYYHCHSTNNLQAGKKPAMFLQKKIAPHEDEGFIQKAPVDVAYSVRPNQTLYISVWAVNKVSRLGSVGSTR